MPLAPKKLEEGELNAPSSMVELLNKTKLGITKQKKVLTVFPFVFFCYYLCGNYRSNNSKKCDYQIGVGMPSGHGRRFFNLILSCDIPYILVVWRLPSGRVGEGRKHIH